ncbi:MAG: crossover junction endodeoxyribonuclease RuvC [Firmicutes bacterium]|nr:crossover junction endodeoxyribonuclease RuvC [Bacillota bacterium]
MRMLGIDPGTALCGWGVVDHSGSRREAVDYGVISTPAKMDGARRLQIIYDELHQIIYQYAPQQAAIEKLFFGRNTTTALSVGQARGVVLLALVKAQIPIVEVTPTQVKQAVAGYGRASKQQIQLMVTRLLRLAQIPTPDDVADALAIALTGGDWLHFQEVVRDR